MPRDTTQTDGPETLIPPAPVKIMPKFAKRFFSQKETKTRRNARLSNFISRKLRIKGESLYLFVETEDTTVRVKEGKHLVIFLADDPTAGKITTRKFNKKLRARARTRGDRHH